MNRRVKDINGFTMIELIITGMIMSAVGLGVMKFMEMSKRQEVTSNTIEQENSALNELRIALMKKRTCDVMLVKKGANKFKSAEPCAAGSVNCIIPPRCGRYGNSNSNSTTPAGMNECALGFERGDDSNIFKIQDFVTMPDGDHIEIEGMAEAEISKSYKQAGNILNKFSKEYAETNKTFNPFYIEEIRLLGKTPAGIGMGVQEIQVTTRRTHRYQSDKNAAGEYEGRQHVESIFVPVYTNDQNEILSCHTTLLGDYNFNLERAACIAAGGEFEDSSELCHMSCPYSTKCADPNKLYSFSVNADGEVTNSTCRDCPKNFNGVPDCEVAKEIAISTPFCLKEGISERITSNDSICINGGGFKGNTDSESTRCRTTFSNQNCPSGQIFTGLDQNGTKKCENVTCSGSEVSSFHYTSSFRLDGSKRSVHCTPLRPPTGCELNRGVKEINVKPDGTKEVICRDRSVFVVDCTNPSELLKSIDSINSTPDCQYVQYRPESESSIGDGWNLGSNKYEWDYGL